jgi:hypothetical protein
VSFSIQSFCCTYNTITYIHGAFPFAFLTPCWFSFAPLCVPFASPSTYLAPSSRDRNRPPPSQVACKLTLFAPPFTQLTHPSQIPRTPPAPRLTMTTLGIFRLLLFGTFIIGLITIYRACKAGLPGGLLPRIPVWRSVWSPPWEHDGHCDRSGRCGHLPETLPGRWTTEKTVVHIVNFHSALV